MTSAHPLAYPPAPREDLVETPHGLPVADPYRTLEDLEGEAGRAWAEGQDALFAAQRATWPQLAAWERRLAADSAARRVSAPVWRGSRYFTERYLPGREQAVLYVTEADGTERVVVDADAAEPRGGVRLAGWRPSWEGDLVACQFAVDGADTTRLEVYAADGSGLVDGPVGPLRHSPVAWLPGGKSFYYVGPAAEGPSGLLRVKLHQLGRPATEDEEVFGEQTDGFAYFGLTVAPDGSRLAVSVARGVARHNDLWLARDVWDDPARPVWRPLVDGAETGALTSIRLHRDGGARLHTDREAPRGRILVTDCVLAKGWRELVPEDPQAALDESVLLDGPALPEPLLLVCWSQDATSRVTVHRAADGRRTGEVPLPGSGAVKVLRTRPEGGHQVWFTYTDFGTPPTVYVFDALTGQVSRWPGEQALPRPRVPAAETATSQDPHPESPELTAQQVRYEADDGTPVLLFLLGPADATHPQASPRPTLLTGYGGFGTPMRPGYNPFARAWAQAGGVYAVACVRGGGEHGTAWHAAGRGAAKSRAVDDFNDAARYLIDRNITAPDRLGAYGQSNGGLLVTAAMTRRPELYAAVTALGPLCDMARYERFGIGHTWTAEYGSAADREQLAGLLGYSPYHQVRPGTRYPAVLLCVADTDHRTGAQHVRKMCAALQHATTGPGPVLMRRTTTGGHAHASARTAHELGTDVAAFLAHHTGLVT
ncbi:S9 family peptidase [Streptomyces oryzae]|uniref:S9 family peptidase n=1 Tax=Streptomyces oryzae TaxID=1434886 RepID=A0ABS3X8G2_9ACTN|nr:prolyl oligopeptidase family serine peptidase [Streptomyces oryzae]MBO8191657.1 S9 family peptidase [Streptomyces oryzae]